MSDFFFCRSNRQDADKLFLAKNNSKIIVELNKVQSKNK